MRRARYIERLHSCLYASAEARSQEQRQKHKSYEVGATHKAFFVNLKAVTTSKIVEKQRFDKALRATPDKTETLALRGTARNGLSN
jgi:hypothetical protein